MKKILPLSDSDFRARSDAFGKQMFRESDRGLVLISAAILEENLELLVRSVMRTGSKIDRDVINPLFRSDGPLSSFAAKTRICYALEFIDEPTFNDLNIIRSIRNDFAHSYSDANLDLDSVRDRIEDLNYSTLLEHLLPPDADIYFQYDEASENRKRVSETKKRFIIALVVLSGTLEGAAREFQKRQMERYGDGK